MYKESPFIRPCDKEDAFRPWIPPYVTREFMKLNDEYARANGNPKFRTLGRWTDVGRAYMDGWIARVIVLTEFYTMLWKTDYGRKLLTYLP